MSALIEGAYAAVLTPRLQTGEIDEAAFRGLLQFLLSRGICGFAVNGATGEFPLTKAQEFDRLVAIAAETVKGRGSFLAGIGGASAGDSIRLGKIAAKAGAAGVLLPMPYFFPYGQGDLKAFCRTVTTAMETPVLLYNLPQFTSGLEPQTSLELIRECDGIVGIKDSSGSLDTLRLLTEAGIGARRIVGSDSVLAQALEERVLDGVVSGIACALPELVGALYAVGLSEPGEVAFRELAALLGTFSQQFRAFPVPWALKLAVQARGLMTATFSLPLSEDRERQAADFVRWFDAHRAELRAQ